MGKIIASAAIMCGVLVLALPITIIVDNFIKVAQDEQQAEQQKLDQVFLLKLINLYEIILEPTRPRSASHVAAS